MCLFSSESNLTLILRDSILLCWRCVFKLRGSLCPVCCFAGLLESSMRLKPHEAQSYRKKALWVSWVSIMITIVLAIAAFSE